MSREQLRTQPLNRMESKCNCDSDKSSRWTDPLLRLRELSAHGGPLEDKTDPFRLSSRDHKPTMTDNVQPSLAGESHVTAVQSGDAATTERRHSENQVTAQLRVTWIYRVTTYTSQVWAQVLHTYTVLGLPLACLSTKSWKTSGREHSTPDRKVKPTGVRRRLGVCLNGGGSGSVVVLLGGFSSDGRSGHAC